jgi:hypothetical protein
MATIDEIRTYCAEILRVEAAHVAGRPDATIEERQRRGAEVEFAHRLRARLTDLDTFLNAQGKLSERDIVSDTSRLEIEIKYFANEVPQGGDVPMSDWEWLIGRVPRVPRRDFARIWWLILPRAGYGIGSKGPGNGAQQEVGRWNFQDCLSFTPTTDDARLPFVPITEVVYPTNKGG